MANAITTIDTHGLSIDIASLVAASNETRAAAGTNGRLVCQINYNSSTGDVYATPHVGDNSWTVHGDPDVWTICYTVTYMSPQRIADKIAEMSELESD